MGISEITILNTEKQNVKPEHRKLRKQAVAASKQSLRFFFPKINDVTKLSDFIKKCKSGNDFCGALRCCF